MIFQDSYLPEITPSGLTSARLETLREMRQGVRRHGLFTLSVTPLCR